MKPKILLIILLSLFIIFGITIEGCVENKDYQTTKYDIGNITNETSDLINPKPTINNILWCDFSYPAEAPYGSMTFQEGLIISNGVLVIVDNSGMITYLYGLNTSNGDNLWKYKYDLATQLSAGNDILVGLFHKHYWSNQYINALNISNGKVLWRYENIELPSGAKKWNFLC